MRNTETKYTYVIRPGTYHTAGGYPPPTPYPARKISFSHRELKEISVSVLVLTTAFTMILARSAPSLPIALLTAAGAVISGFFLHEMGHKFTAQRYGCWAEFRVWSTGLLIALVTATAGFLFAAPGAVYIAGAVDIKRNGKISLAGPMTNLAVASIFTVGAILAPSPTLYFVLLSIAFLNTFLGLFNMLPFPPLDGSKVLKWSKAAYISTIAALGALLLLLW